jgi:hypothetical protein
LVNNIASSSEAKKNQIFSVFYIFFNSKIAASRACPPSVKLYMLYHIFKTQITEKREKERKRERENEKDDLHRHLYIVVKFIACITLLF